MSAYVVDDKTICALAKAFVDYGVKYNADEPLGDDGDYGWIVFANERRKAIAQSLLQKNYDSVNYRYNEDDECPKINYIDVDIDEGIVYGCIQCYEYQACEEPDWMTSEIYYSLERLKDKVLTRALARSGMKAYWGYPDEDERNEMDVL